MNPSLIAGLKSDASERKQFLYNEMLVILIRTLNGSDGLSIVSTYIHILSSDMAYTYYYNSRVLGGVH